MKHARINGPAEALGIDDEVLELLPLDSPDVVVNKFFKITRKSQYIERR
jgi:hypothetical protein